MINPLRNNVSSLCGQNAAPRIHSESLSRQAIQNITWKETLRQNEGFIFPGWRKIQFCLKLKSCKGFINILVEFLSASNNLRKHFNILFGTPIEWKLVYLVTIFINFWGYFNSNNTAKCFRLHRIKEKNTANARRLQNIVYNEYLIQE